LSVWGLSSEIVWGLHGRISKSQGIPLTSTDFAVLD
jgi:hypothetical protein